VLGIAQGAARVHWFEGRDGDSGPFGLEDAGGAKRRAYFAVQRLTAALGPTPRYSGWVLLGAAKQYGFVFQGAAGPVLVAWPRPGTTDTVSFSSAVQAVDLVSGEARSAATVALSGPVLVTGRLGTLTTQARRNRARPFPWGGDFSQAQAVSFTAPSTEAGLHPLGAAPLTPDGARDCSGGTAQRFAVDPNFLSYDTVPVRVTAVVRRNGAASAGFNLKYESTSGYRSTGEWFTIPEGSGWTTRSWTLTDVQLVGKWGYNLALDSDATEHSGYSLQRLTVEKLAP
jgi:hypothetical protein